MVTASLKKELIEEGFKVKYQKRGHWLLYYKGKRFQASYKSEKDAWELAGEWLNHINALNVWYNRK